MKAMVINSFGDPEVFEKADLAVPEVKPGHVLIRVAATSVNPIDWKIRKGLVPPITAEFPAVLHGDVAGTVEKVGEGVREFQAGEEVYGCAGGVVGHGGALGELMLADARLIAHKPKTLKMEEAAVLPLVGITAWDSLILHSRVTPGQRVLVHGGAGGVGHIGVQLARAAGGIVYTTVSSEEKAAIAKDLGADYTINYREKGVEEYVEELTGGEGFDVVFDTVGGANIAASFQAIKRGGIVATIAARSTEDLSVLHTKGATLHVIFMLLPMLTGHGRERHGEILRHLARLVDAGRVRPVLDPETFSLEDVARAHAKLEANEAVGKICVKVV